MNASGSLHLEDCQFLADSQSVVFEEVDPSEPVSECAAASIVLTTYQAIIVL
jgi:hypothetical protein